MRTKCLLGLENSVLPYVHSFMNNKVNGQQLLNLRTEDLEQLGVFKIGHQEIILEAVEYLRNFHYELDRENLQLLAMRLSCTAHSLYNELAPLSDSNEPVSTQTLSDVVAIIVTVKPLIRWLDRPPFSGQLDYNDKKHELLKLSLEMATCAQRDRFAEKPIEEIRTTCGQMAKLADYIIQDVADPMILQPSSLDLATLKKRPGDDLGFSIIPSFHGAHQIAEIKFGSAAHQCAKMEEGDEIVQVNYQTVVGWERKNVLDQFRESPSDVILTLKRRPKHTKVYGQIYIKPYRLPSNKKAPYAARWQNNLPSPRPELLTIPDFTLPLHRAVPKAAAAPKPVSILDTMTTDESSDESSESEATPTSVRLYSTKPRNPVQRRATFAGALPTVKSSAEIEEFWKELKREHSTSFQFRNKAASCAQDLDSVSAAMTLARPQTCLGIEQRAASDKSVARLLHDAPRKVQFQEGQQRLKPRPASFKKQQATDPVLSGISQSQSVNLERAAASNDESPEPRDDIVLSEKESGRIEDGSDDRRRASPAATSSVPNSSSKERGRLDKSHSTPAYDLTESDDDFLERKFEAALDEHHKQQLQQRSRNDSSPGSHASSFNKSDSRVFDSTDDLEEFDKVISPSPAKEQLEHSIKTRGVGNVARKIIDIEKNLQNIIHDKSPEKVSNCKSSEKPNVVSELSKINIDIKINDADLNDDLDEPCDDSGNITSDLESDEDTYQSKLVGKSRSGSKSIDSNLDTSQMNQNRSSIDIEKTFDIQYSFNDGTSQEMENMDCANRKEEKVVEIELKVNDKPLDKCPNQWNVSKVTIENVRVGAEFNKTIGTESIDKNCSISPTSFLPLGRPETPKREVTTRPEVRPRLTPPEPPPRKFINIKPATHSNTNNSPPSPLHVVSSFKPRDPQVGPHFMEKPRVPERPSVRRELKKINPPCEVYPRDEKGTLASRVMGECFETSSPTFVDKSRDASEETNCSFLPSSPFDEPHAYMQIPELSPSDSAMRHHHAPPPSSQSSSLNRQHQHKREHSSPSADTADGACHSRQSSSTSAQDNELRSPDKERSVVNKAMMVARSIGLHGNSSKFSNSPRSSRKRTSPLAKQRNVAAKDVSPGELEDWLTYRSRGAGGAWARAWFILKGSSLYRFRAQNSTKADCLIALAGFTSAQAAEIKSRKYAFKVYYTGTMFYFAADTEDSLNAWLDAIKRATLGTERTSGIFTETDESDSEHKSKPKSTSDAKAFAEKTFGSLKKFGKKDSSSKEQDVGGASLDRKYLKFLGGKSQNVPVPTAQFRSYRRVLPNSPAAPTKPVEKYSSPDLQMTIAGSTFYGLNSSQSTTDVPGSSQDMGDYRRTTERVRSNRNRRPDELQGFITLEAFMLARQEEECQRVANNINSNNSSEPNHFTPLNNDHVHFQHRNIANSANVVQNNGMIYGSPRNVINGMPSVPTSSTIEHHSSNRSFDSESRNNSHRANEVIGPRTSRQSNELNSSQPGRPNDKDLQQQKLLQNRTNQEQDVQHRQAQQSNAINGNEINFSTLDYGERLKPQAWLRAPDSNSVDPNFQHDPRKVFRNKAHMTSSSGNLAYQTCTESLHRVKRESPIARNGSFNLADRRHRDHVHPERNWTESLKASDKKSFKCQPTACSIPPFNQEGLKHNMEHQNKSLERKGNKSLRNLFGNKNSQKSSSFDMPHDQQKTLLGSPRLHRAIFGDKNARQRQNSFSGNQSHGDAYVNQSPGTYENYNFCRTPNLNVGDVNSHGEWLSEAPTNQPPKCMVAGVALCQIRQNPRHPSTPPTLPYIPPPTSPPPDYPGLQYPPIFEPGTYSLADASILRHRGSKNSQN
ncbi:hypothetical protein TKK_0011338 [Trichogramma kaykai]